MSSWDELENNIGLLHKNLHVDDIGEDNISILYYGDNTDDLLNEIENILSEYDKNNFLYNVRVGKDTDQYLLLSYKCNIGEDLQTEEELYQRSLDDSVERKMIFTLWEEEV